MRETSIVWFSAPLHSVRDKTAVGYTYSTAVLNNTSVRNFDIPLFQIHGVVAVWPSLQTTGRKEKKGKSLNKIQSEVLSFEFCTVAMSLFVIKQGSEASKDWKCTMVTTLWFFCDWLLIVLADRCSTIKKGGICSWCRGKRGKTPILRNSFILFYFF